VGAVAVIGIALLGFAVIGVTSQIEQRQLAAGVSPPSSHNLDLITVV